MPFDPNPLFDAQMEALFDECEEVMAKAAAAFLVDALDKAGTGTHWKGQPHPSSAPGHYPAIQTGDLRDSIDARKLGNEWHFGSFDAPPEAFALEYPSPPGSPITRETGHGARPWLSKMLNDSAALRQVWNSLNSIAGRSF